MRNPQLLTVAEVSSCGTAGQENGTVSHITSQLLRDMAKTGEFQDSLRDLAAIAAMQGILSISETDHHPAIVASAAVSYADALLAELEKEKP
jgi:hypothetical protein